MRMLKLTLIEKDRCIIYFIRWLTCGWKEAYFIEMFKRHRAAEFILRGIRINLFQRFSDRNSDSSDKPAFMLSDGFIRNQKQFTCDKDWFGNFDVLSTLEEEACRPSETRHISINIRIIFYSYPAWIIVSSFLLHFHLFNLLLYLPKRNNKK